MKRIVLTGATGSIGRPLFAALTSRGYGVVVLTRDPERAETIVPGALGYARWDERGVGAWARELEGAHALIHLAGAPLFAGKVNTAQVDRTNEGKVASTAAFAEALGSVGQPPSVWLNASSQGYYGFAPQDADTVSTEASPAGRDYWGQGNRRWEEAAHPAEALGVRLVSLRTGVYLPRQGGPLAGQLEQFRRGWGGWVGSGRHSYNWIHEDDEIGLIVWALENDAVRGPLNLVAPNPVTHRAFAETLGRLLGKPARRSLPPFVLGLMMGKPAEIIVNSHKVVPDKASRLGYRFEFQTLEPALRDLLSKELGQP